MSAIGHYSIISISWSWGRIILLLNSGAFFNGFVLEPSFVSIEWDSKHIENLQQVTPRENMALWTAWILRLETRVGERTRPLSLDTWVFWLTCVLRAVIGLPWVPSFRLEFLPHTLFLGRTEWLRECRNWKMPKSDPTCGCYVWWPMS